MSRKKVKLAFITNDSARKATYKKRKNGLLKKAREISTLCDVKACVIIYSPYEAQPVIWPPSDVDVQRVLGLFRSMPEMDQSKKMVNQQTFLRERIVKIKDQLKKLIKDNREKEMVEVMFQCLLGTDMSNMLIMDLNDLAWLIDSFIREIVLVSEKIKRAGGANVSHANVARSNPAGDQEDIKLLMNPNMVNPASGAAPFAFNAMHSQTVANWPYPRDFVSNYGALSTSAWLPPPQLNMNGIVFNSTAAGGGASSSNNQLSGTFPRLINEMMMMPPAPHFNVGGFADDFGASSFSNNNYQPCMHHGVVSNETMLQPPPPSFNVGGMPPKQP